MYTLLISKKSVKVIILCRQVMFAVIRCYASYSNVHTELMLHNKFRYRQNLNMNVKLFMLKDTHT